MTDKKFRLGLLVMVLVFGMMLVGCGDGSTSGDGDTKTIIITVITGKKGDVRLDLCSDDGEDIQGVAEGVGTISNNSIIISLFEATSTPFEAISTPFTEDGPYKLFLYFFDEDSVFVYTNGLTLAALGITDAVSIYEAYAELYSKIPEYTISSTSSTIPFSKFVNVPDELWEF